MVRPVFRSITAFGLITAPTLDPRRSNIAFDANALNRHGTKQDALVDWFESYPRTACFM